jgi:N-acetylglucosamine kinase-like BadF-type ATPase
VGKKDTLACVLEGNPMKPNELVLIADAGATHTRALVATTEGRILGSGRSGAGNAFAIGTTAASSNLRKTLDMALKDARVRPSRVNYTVIGTASVTSDGRGSDPIVKDLKPYLANSKIAVVGDARIALEGALAGAPGVVTVAGTGSIVLGKDAAGRLLRVGGWGPLAGDEGSAQWIGRRAIQEAAHAADGVTKPTQLLNAVRRHFDVRKFAHIIDVIYAHPMTPAELGALAPLVTRAADRGDVVAREIFKQGAVSLARQVAAAARRLHLKKPLVSHQGSMFTVEKHFRGEFEKQLLLHIRGAQFVAPALSPLGGAFLLALQGCGLEASIPVVNTFKTACHE